MSVIKSKLLGNQYNLNESVDKNYHTASAAFRNDTVRMNEDYLKSKEVTSGEWMAAVKSQYTDAKFDTDKKNSNRILAISQNKAVGYFDSASGRASVNTKDGTSIGKPIKKSDPKANQQVPESKQYAENKMTGKRFSPRNKVNESKGTSNTVNESLIGDYYVDNSLQLISEAAKPAQDKSLQMTSIPEALQRKDDNFLNKGFSVNSLNNACDYNW